MAPLNAAQGGGLPAEKLETGKEPHPQGWLRLEGWGDYHSGAISTFELPFHPFKGTLPPSGRRGGGCPFSGEWIQSLQHQKFLISPSLPIGHYRWATVSSGQTSATGVGPLQAPAPPGGGGRAQQGAPGAARRRLEEAGRPAARGCAPVCVQSGRAGCAPSRAAMRKQTRGDSSAPSAPSALALRPPPARPAPRARPPGRPAQPPPRAARTPAPPRPRRAGLTYRPPRARSRTTRPAPPARPDRGLRRAR